MVTTSTRICVSAANPQATQETALLLEDVMPRLEAAHRKVVDSFMPGSSEPFVLPVVVRGCPPEAKIPSIGNDGPAAAVQSAVREVPQAGANQITVLVADTSGRDDQITGPRGWAVGPAEEVCDGHVCAQVSTALYVSERAVKDTEVLQRAIETALGWSVARDYPDGHPASENETRKDGTRP